MGTLTCMRWRNVKKEFTQLFDSVVEESALPIRELVRQSPKAQVHGRCRRIRGFMADRRMAVLVWFGDHFVAAFEDGETDVMTYSAEHSLLLDGIDLPDTEAAAFCTLFGGVFNGVSYPMLEERLRGA